MKNLLKRRIKELNNVIIDNAFNLKKHQQDEDNLDRKFNWLKNEIPEIKGTFIDKDGNVTFKM